MKKKIRNIDGVRVIHRYSPTIILYALFALIICACSVGTYFLPFLNIKVGEEVVATFNPFLDLWKSFVIWDDTFATNPVYNFIVTNGVKGTPVQLVTMWAMILIAFNTYLAGLFDLLIGIRAVFIFILGKTRRFNGIRKLAKKSFFYRLFQSIFIAALVLFLMFTQKEASVAYVIDYMYPAYYLGATFVSLIVISILYAAVFKECVYRNEIGELSSQKTDNPL